MESVCPQPLTPEMARLNSVAARKVNFVRFVGTRKKELFMKRANYLLIVGASWFLLVSSAAAQNTKKTDAGDSGEKIYDRTLHSTVWVLLPISPTRARTGSGSLIDVNRRLVLTNYHVVLDDDSGFVSFPIFQNGKLVAERDAYRAPGKKIPAKVVARDPKRDLAVLQLEGPVPAEAKAIRLAKDGPSPGQRVHSIGNPGASGALWVYTEGSVRQVYRNKIRTMDRETGKGFEIDARVVETQSPVNQGDSGGPVVNDKGELVAVVQGHVPDAQARSVSIFIDVSEVRDLLVSKHLAKLPPKEPEKPVDVQPASQEEKVQTAEDIAAKKERDAARQLKYVKTFVSDGKKDLARNHCEEIIEKYPDTKAAKEAKELLEKLKE
jgi:S1-C subfamily serine protease